MTTEEKLARIEERLGIKKNYEPISFEQLFDWIGNKCPFSAFDKLADYAVKKGYNSDEYTDGITKMIFDQIHNK